MSTPEEQPPIILKVDVDEKGRIELRDRVSGRRVAFQGVTYCELSDDFEDLQTVDLELVTDLRVTQKLYEQLNE